MAKLITPVQAGFRQLQWHQGLTNEAYHALKAVSPSQIKELKRSPAHYFDRFLAPDREKKPPTKSMIKGSALHIAVLEPLRWDAEVAVPRQAFDRRSNAGKVLAAAFEAESAGKLVLDPEDADEVRRMADAVRRHPAARHLLALPGRAEASYVWEDEQTGLQCKSRPDWHTTDFRLVLEVKTAEDASREAFQKAVSNYDYHVQAAWNKDALGAEEHIYIVVENVRPYAVAVYPSSVAMITAGQRRIESSMALLAECWHNNRWPAYGDTISEPIDLPGWNRD